MSLRAVVFDYGMVLTGPPDPAAHAAMVRITGLSIDRFESLYWADRHAYDEGALTGISFWQKLVSDGKIDLGQPEIEELNRQDALMWTTQNPVMVAWQQQLKQRGLKTAILSNMGDSVLDSITRAFPWIDNFDIKVWSYQLRMAKPDPAIYLHTLALLGTQPEETVFIDDKAVNIDAARALGIVGIEFSTAEKLRADLIALGLDRELPLP